jgi:hypothetical protein
MNHIVWLRRKFLYDGICGVELIPFNVILHNKYVPPLVVFGGIQNRDMAL